MERAQRYGREERAERSEEHTSELQSHSDLHSSPTRRSSDLFPSVKERAQRCSRPTPSLLSSRLLRSERSDAVGPPLSLLFEGQRESLSALSSQPLWSERSDTVGKKGQRDRKSTRLNSSHTVIYTLPLHDALPISSRPLRSERSDAVDPPLRSSLPDC